MLRLRLGVGAVVLSVVLAVGCGGGVNEKSLTDAQNRIDALKAKGVPGDTLSNAGVYLYQAREHFSKNNGALAKKSADSLKFYLEKAEKYYQDQVSTLGPTIDAAKSTALKAKEEVSGYQARKIDSALAVVDSLRKLDWLLQANNVAQELVALLPSLKEDEAKAKNLGKLVPGEWVTENRTKSEEFKEVNALERKVCTFYRDGKVYLEESKKGQSGPFFKEDWMFKSWGTYGYKGDTIMLSISRFKAERQMFQKARNDNGKAVDWKNEPGATYDSAITDGSQDRFVTYDDLKADFSRKKSF
jgi:outer membrane murein-binding lipoprotein Lpp